MNFRHEWKHEINMADMRSLRRRLEAVMQPDSHGENGEYRVRSLYFDTPTDKALREKLDGVDRREKFRIRFYNGDTSLIHLEKKSKIRGLCSKQSAALSLEETQKLLKGETDWMACSDRELLRELFFKMRFQGLRPKTVVEYTRQAYVFGPGNVRVTLDYDLRTAIGCRNFLSPQRPDLPPPDSPIILEVKWDSFLPDIIRSAVSLPSRQSSPFSKYAACRAYF